MVPLVLRTAFCFIPSAMTGSIVSVFSYRNRVSANQVFEGREPGEGKLSRPVLRGPGGRKAAWLLGRYRWTTRSSPDLSRYRTGGFVRPKNFSSEVWQEPESERAGAATAQR